MSINWVMLAPAGDSFIKLPGERILHTSAPRTSLHISTPDKFPGTQPFSAQCEAGVVYVTNQRIVYLPSTPKPELKSFSSPILNLQDAYVRAPFFGANYWTALCKTVAGGGIPASHPAVEVRLTFREGGAFDFHTIFEQIKERLYNAHILARENGQQAPVDVDLEQLPAYEPAREVENHDDEPVILSPVPTRPGRRNSDHDSDARTTNNPPNFTAPPDEPPPGYEEAQVQAVGEDLEERLRRGAEKR